MTEQGAVVVVGGTRGLGLELVRHYARAGRDVVVSPGGRKRAAAEAAAAVRRPGPWPRP